MKKLVIVLMVITAFTVVSCEKVEDFNLSVVSVWVNPQYNDSIITFERSNKLPENNYGIEIKANGFLKERKNAGWCGTPPVAYSDFDGTWNIKDNILNVRAAFWGGTETKQWKIISIDDKNLVVKQLKLEYAYKQQ